MVYNKDGDNMKFPVTNLLNWYKQNQRTLPWREDTNPYHVWISEIMLQQTRIEAVIDYYNRFIEQIPNIKSLAQIDDQKLLKLWEGLGYYNRAHNLKKAAILIQEKYHGIFPNHYEDILSLPGIGEYTASAIGSISFSLKEVTVDGNVLRVYMRFFGKKDCVDDLKFKKQVRADLMHIIPNQSGDFNQGLMELGETICLPNGIPKCEECPIKEHCQTRKNRNFNEIPVKKKKSEKKIEKYSVLLFLWNDKVAIAKRKENDVLKNLYEFPNIPMIEEKNIKTYLINQHIDYDNFKIGPSYTHIFTHKKWDMNSYVIYLKTLISSYEFKTIYEIEQSIAIPTAFKPFLTYLKNNP